MNDGRPGDDLVTAAIWATTAYANGATDRATQLATILDDELGRPAGTTLGTIRGLLSCPSGNPGGITCAA
jgi:hypothetical protein